MKYKLCDWEENGYHDSYGYIAYYDDETREVKCLEHWATAYYGGADISDLLPPTPEAVSAACSWLEQKIYEKIRAAELRDVLEPESVQRGAELVLVRNCKHKGQSYSVGLTGRVFWSGAYGQFYRNGYSRPGRANTRVGLELNSGEKVFVALSACRLSREPMSDTELQERARSLSLDCQFGKALSSRHAWDSHNWAADVLHAAEHHATAAA